MYKVTKDGKILTITDHLLHCKDQPNGIKIIADDGPGVIVNGTIYNLPGYQIVTVEELSDVRGLINEILAESETADEIYMALAELGQLVAGGADHG